MYKIVADDSVPPVIHAPRKCPYTWKMKTNSQEKSERGRERERERERVGVGCDVEEEARAGIISTLHLI